MIRSIVAKLFIFIFIIICGACSKEIIQVLDDSLFDDYQHSFSIKTTDDLKRYFAYNSGDDIIISGHRGGNYSGFPENCLETFDKMLYCGPIFYEIDPRLTKDGKIVLMHDASLDRTTSFSGNVSDYLYDDLKTMKLKDANGRETAFCIPSLCDVIEWSQNRTILNFDYKDVPPKMICDLLTKLKAKNCIFTIHSVDEAKEILAYDSDICFSAFVGSMEKFDQYEKAGILPNIVIAYLENSVVRDNKLLSTLHSYGIRSMVSTAPTEGIPPSRDFCEYVIASGPDIIESNYPADYCVFEKVRHVW